MLQVVVANEPHIAGFRRVADLRRAGNGDDGRLFHLRDGREREHGKRRTRADHRLDHTTAIHLH